MIGLPNKSIQAIIDYMTQRPYREVAELLSQLRAEYVELPDPEPQEIIKLTM